MDAGEDNSLHLSDFDVAPARPDERRREPRVACERPIAVLPYPNKKFLNGRFVDCSMRGVGLVLTESLPVDERFLLKLRGESLTLLIYSIRNCRPMDDRFRIGGELCGCIGTVANIGDRGILKMLLGGASIECL
jgi:hypothetical protein